MSDSLEDFYQSWSSKSQELIDYTNEAAVRKIDALFDGMPQIKDLNLKTMLDYGCGYGKALQHCAERLNLVKSYGFDFSEAAIDYAVHHFRSDRLEYHRLASLNSDGNVKHIRSITGGKIDCILLIDLLEHIPDCKDLILKLSALSDLFIVKLPIEDNVIDNYVLKKEYPSTKQANGHLREFTANTVFYFIRNLGLTPIAEGLHVYDFRDSYPPPPAPLTLSQLVNRNIVKSFRMTMSFLLPRKIYIRLFGPGSYYCIATFNKDHFLNP